MFRLPSGERVLRRWCHGQWFGNSGRTQRTWQDHIGQDLVCEPLVIKRRYHRRPPFGNPALEGAELHVGILLGSALLKLAKDRFGRARRIGLEPVFNLHPNIGEGIQACPPPARDVQLLALIDPLVMHNRRQRRIEWCGMLGQATGSSSEPHGRLTTLVGGGRCAHAGVLPEGIPQPPNLIKQAEGILGIALLTRVLLSPNVLARRCCLVVGSCHRPDVPAIHHDRHASYQNARLTLGVTFTFCWRPARRRAEARSWQHEAR